MILALIQARMGATRLPGKVLKPLAGVPLIDHVLARVQAAACIDRVCVCIPDTAENDVLAAHLEGLAVDVYRGSEDDVLGRFYWAAERFPDANPIVRITADDPFKDPALIEYAVAGFLAAWAEPDEYAGAPQYLHLGGLTWPLGMDVEVFTRDALFAAHQTATRPDEREHVTAYMARKMVSWVLRDPEQRGDMNMRWTIDTAADLEFAGLVYDALYELDPLFGYDDILDMLGRDQ